MAARNEMQIEKLIDEVTRTKDFQLLEQFMSTEVCENVSYKCSKQFVNKLDKLFCRELDKEEVKNISTLLKAIQKCGENVSIAGEKGLPAMTKHGLIGKIKGILILSGSAKNEMLINLAEDFFNVLLDICENGPEGEIQILENFVLRICSLIADVRISIYVQQEVVRKFNLILNNAPRDARKKILSTKEMLLVVGDMGRRILDAGDYDLQVAITEALCRMVPEKQRGELACQWFSMEFVSSAFKGIKDSEFETDCRKFLNQVNGILGDKRRVFTYPCLSAALDKYELRIPLDENLEEFWVDFNVGSRSISFYVAPDDADHPWETVIIPEEEVDLYSLEERDSNKLLTIDLKSPTNVGNQEGAKFFLCFDSILEIKDAVRKVYGFSKCKGFSKKQFASVAGTTVHVVFDESGSQVMVPESQLSPCLEQKPEEEEKYKTQQHPGNLKTLNKNNNQENCRGSSSKVKTSCKRKVSEASVVIPGGRRISTRNPLLFVSTSTPCAERFKLPLEIMSSAEKSNWNAVNETRAKDSHQEPAGSGQRCKLDKECCETEQKIGKSNSRSETKLPEKKKSAEEVFEMMQETEIETTQKQTLGEALDIVPDSQPVGRGNKPWLSGLLESSFDRTKTWKKRACSVPEANITTGNKQKLNASLAHMLQPARMSETSLHSDFTKEESDVLSRKETSNPKQLKKGKSKEIKDATKSLISNISDRYKVKTDAKSKARDSLGLNRIHLNKSWVSKEEVQDRNLKNTTHNMNDIYNFNVGVFDEPEIKIQGLRVTEPSVHRDPNKKGNTNDSKTCTEVKGNKKTRNNQNKKHLFSDTDTEYRDDDSKTEFSWLRDSNRKPKAQIMDYSRDKNFGKQISTDRNKFTGPACQVDKPKGKNSAKKKINEPKKQNAKPDELEQTTRAKRPRRAALGKNYKEPSSSESESERAFSAYTPKKEKSKLQKHMNGKPKDDNHQKELQDILCMVPKRGVGDYVQKAFIKSKNSAEQKEMEKSVPESPLSIETMRCAERISEGDVSQEQMYPALQESTPENEEVLNFEKEISPNNFYLKKKNISTVCLNRISETTVKKLRFGNNSFSPGLTEASLLNLSTHTTVSRKHVKGSVCETRGDKNEEDSGFSCCFSDSVSIKGKLQVTMSPITKSKDEVCVSPSPLSVSSGSKVQCWGEERYDPMQESGPTIQTFLKRSHHSGTESNSDEVEPSKEGKKGKRTKLQPRELFKTDDAATYRATESLSSASGNDLSGLDGEIWEPDCSTIGLCQKLQKEFTKKMESRSRKVDHFTKHSLRAVNEHLTTVSYQLREYRIRQLDKFNVVLLEELENYERDTQSLKNMEKEFLSLWEKHTCTFSTYRKNEQQRIQVLKTSFDKNIYHTVDSEECIFTSEMHLMKEDIKGLQEKLLKEMQEEELCNVRRSLQALFLPEDRILK